MSDEPSRGEMRAYRASKFAIEVGKDRHGIDGEIALSITHNGYQWQTVALFPDEARKVIKALSDYLDKP